MVRLAAAALSVCLAVSPASAQTAAPAAAGHADPAKAYDALLGAFEAQMMGVAKAMPADKYNFTPSGATFAPGQGAKFDGVRSFGGQAKHIAQANYYFYSAVSGSKPDVDVQGIGNLKTKDEIVAALATSFAFAHKAVLTLTPANELDSVEADGTQTRATAVAFGIAHGFDHYGQMVEYLRMSGIVPPGSK